MLAYKQENIPYWETWIFVGLLIMLEIMVILFLAEGEKMFPGFLTRFSILYVTSISELFAICYCGRRFGCIRLGEFFPHGRDWVILGIAVFLIFGYFGITVGREGLEAEMHEAIRPLPIYQYWLCVLNIVALGPIIEESIYRRYLLEGLHLHHSTPVAILMASGIATAFHWGLPFWALIFTFIVQILFSIVYINSRLGVSVLTHGFLNMLVLFLSR